ncbi:unnamed protein product, partial [Ectocarpus sp. 12 AP-2014]
MQNDQPCQNTKHVRPHNRSQTFHATQNPYSHRNAKERGTHPKTNRYIRQGPGSQFFLQNPTLHISTTKAGMGINAHEELRVARIRSTCKSLYCRDSFNTCASDS